MTNKFKVSTLRFHTKEKNKLLVIGYFNENIIGENKLLVKLGHKELKCEIEAKERMLANTTSTTGKLITKDYYIWISLPEDWEKANKFQLWNCDVGDEQLVLDVSISKLIRLSRKVSKHVDKGNVIDGGFKINGWYIDCGDMKVQFLDMQGNKLDVVMSRKRRADVNRVFPENSEDEVVGFEAVYKGDIPKGVRVHFETKDKQQDYTLKLLHSPLEKKLQKIRKLCGKARLHYHQFGVKATLLKIFDKIIGKDSITYKAWYKRHCPTNAILKRQSEHVFAYQPKISIVIPLYKTPHKYLDELVNSIKKQTYANWELCLSDGSGKNSPLTDVLRKYELEDSRIRVDYNTKGLQIS